MLDASGAKAGDKQVVAEIEPCIADGMAVDQNGNVWLTCYSYGTAHPIDPDTGEVIERASREQKALTNCVFERGADARAGAEGQPLQEQCISAWSSSLCEKYSLEPCD